jgi:putative copper resistance protein D
MAGAAAVWLASAAPTLAHGTEVPPAPTAATLVLDWSFDPLLQIALLLAAAAYLWAVGRVDARHPSKRVPRSRIVAFLGGIVAIEIALQSGIEAYDTTLFSVHMVQHVLLMMVAAPLLVLGAPITLLLRVASGEQRRRYILPVLHSRVVRAISHPVVAWLLFAAVMWGTHFSAIFDESLESPLIHDLEHLLYLAVALLFWWPAVGVDPTPWRMAYPARILYLFLQMPQNTFLALAIFSASAPLYRHYATLERTWGPTPLADQQAAGAIMWVVGDLIFLLAILGVVLAWMRDEERREARRESRVAAERAAIRAREAALAERLALEAQGSGVDR